MNKENLKKVLEPIKTYIDEQDVQSDWSQNDETAKDYIKNKTHWIEYNVEQELFKDISFTATTDQLYSQPINISTMPSVGDSWTVVFNGTTYQGTAIQDKDVIVCGNNYIGNAQATDTGEPFVIACCLEDSGLMDANIFVKEAGNYVCSANFTGNIIHTIASKYIKDMYYEENVEFSDVASYDTFMLSVQTLNNGNIYKAKIGETIYENIAPSSIDNNNHLVDFTLGENILQLNTQNHTLSITSGNIAVSDITFYWLKNIIHAIPEKYLPESLYNTIDNVNIDINNKMNINNPTGTGSFSMNRKSGTTVGNKSSTLGYNTTASNYGSHAEGLNTTSSNLGSHAEGESTTASGSYSHAEGLSTTASGNGSHAEGESTIASQFCSHAEGQATTASGSCSHAEGQGTIASGLRSHAEGLYTIAKHKAAHVCGEFNSEDPSKADQSDRGTYVIIVGNGNGTSESYRSNAHTLDWNGNAWYAGDVYVGSTSGIDKDEGSKKLATEEYIVTKMNGYVPIESGKGLSSNDYTTKEKTKLEGISEGANKITRVSELENDSGFMTTAQIEGLSNAIAKAEPFFVEFTNTGTIDDPQWSANKTFSEIKSAHDTGRLCYAQVEQKNVIVPLIGFTEYNAKKKAIFSTSVLFSSHLNTQALTITEDNLISIERFVSQSQIITTGLLKGDGDNISAAVAGTDYAAADHTHDYLPLSGGTLTGNLTGKYITGTWLQTTATGNKAGRFATIDDNGWIYYRTASEVASDIGAVTADTFVAYTEAEIQSMWDNISV